MTGAVSAVVLVLSMLVVDICQCQTPASIETCDKLPKHDINSNEIVAANSPYNVDYALSPLLNCGAVVVSKPTCGTTNCHGTVLNIVGCSSSVLHYFVKSDNKTLEVTNCKTGEKTDWYLAAEQFGSTGSFYCIYSCNGTALRDFKCASNNNGTSPAELDAFEMAKKVPNGDQIYNARESCLPSKGS